jgi:hypothetical protein
MRGCWCCGSAYSRGRVVACARFCEDCRSWLFCRRSFRSFRAWTCRLRVRHFSSLHARLVVSGHICGFAVARHSPHSLDPTRVEFIEILELIEIQIVRIIRIVVLDLVFVFVLVAIVLVAIVLVAIVLVAIVLVAIVLVAIVLVAVVTGSRMRITLDTSSLFSVILQIVRQWARIGSITNFRL